jgi:hypothetical protein
MNYPLILAVLLFVLLVGMFVTIAFLRINYPGDE